MQACGPNTPSPSHPAAGKGAPVHHLAGDYNGPSPSHPAAGLEAQIHNLYFEF